MSTGSPSAAEEVALVPHPAVLSTLSDSENAWCLRGGRKARAIWCASASSAGDRVLRSPSFSVARNANPAILDGLVSEGTWLAFFCRDRYRCSRNISVEFHL